ncbi:MAG TPA: tyrosine-type recombinase/integrase [Patescibacteria group bacterium]|nr:tyrosine-type recombinase/integrase [Patescibacteria group bacterium]
MTITEAFAFFDVHVIQNAGMKEKSRKNYATAVNSLITCVSDLPIEFLGLDHIITWKLDMRSRGLTNATINTNLSRVRGILRFLSEHEQHVMDFEQIKRDKEIHVPHTVLTPAEVGLLMEHTKTARDRALIALYFGTGCRLSEILGIDRDAFDKAPVVDEVNNIYEIWVCGKGDKYRPVCFSQEVKDVVDKYLDTRLDYFRPLFMSNQNRRLGPSRVEKMVHEVTRRAGLDKRVTPHVFRHSYVTDLAANGAPIPTISKLVGHKNANVTLGIYTHISVGQGIKAYANYHSGPVVKSPQ